MRCWVCQMQLPPGADRCRECGALQPARWEYRVHIIERRGAYKYSLDPQRAERLNLLGAEGWELVGFSSDNGLRSSTVAHSLVLKRRKLQ